MEVSMCASLSRSLNGVRSNKLGTESLFVFLCRIVSGRTFDLEMGTKRFDVKQERMPGWKKIVPIYQFRDFMGLNWLLGRLYEIFSPLRHWQLTSNPVYPD